MSDITARKAELRRAARARREAIPLQLRIEAAFALAGHVATDSSFDGLDVVGAYLPIAPRSIRARP